MQKEPKGGFWTFEAELEPHFESPSKDLLGNIWQSHHGKQPHLLGDHFYGLYEAPDQPPRAIISLDLCEVVRETGLSLARISNIVDKDEKQRLTSELEYPELYNIWQNEAPSQERLHLMAQQLMHHEQITPVPHHEAIQAFLQRWRQAGVYIIANTSTLSGTEVSTIKFLAETYPDSIQGILLPGNYDGSGKTTKASILDHFKEQASIASNHDFISVPTLAIEDAKHHGEDFINASNVSLFMPAYGWNSSLDDHRITQGLGTVDAFIAVDNYLLEHGIIS